MLTGIYVLIMYNLVWFLLLFGITSSLKAQENAVIYKITESKVYFKSDAPLELIEATSTDLKGLVDFEKATFAFTIASNTFEGFNSKLQREHFNENYLESAQFPKSSFSGKIIEEINPENNGLYEIRTKGILFIHGVEQERIIRAQVKIEDGLIYIKSSFSVLLQEHNITIPKVVYQKIAEEIFVEIEATAERI